MSHREVNGEHAHILKRRWRRMIVFTTIYLGSLGRMSQYQLNSLKFLNCVTAITEVIERRLI
jgi:hypothetical protein